MDRQLERALRNHLADVESAIHVVRDEASSMDISAAELKYTDGKYVIHDLLLAKAQCLNGLAVLKASTP